MLLATAPAFAQPAPPAPNAAQGVTADPHVNERITRMHRLLKIMPAQEPAWEAFAKVMRDNATSTYQAFQRRGASIAAMSSVENLKNLAQLEQARAQGLQTLAYSFETLYGTFSDEQKQIADSMFRHYNGGEGRRREPKKPK
jgi:hypothetical protein